MKQSLILRQHIPYARLIYKALDFCSIMLSKSHTLYPFAVIAIENDIQCVFTPNRSDDDELGMGMIENLQACITERKILCESTISLLVYSATVLHPNKTETDALVLNITDSAGQNTVTIYPYTHTEKAIKLDKPYSCNFSD